MIAKIEEVAGGASLCGATNGLAAMLTITQSIPESSQDQLVVLDFSDIDIATGSFLRSLVLGLRDYCRTNRQGIGVVLANVGESVMEELVDHLQVMREAVVVCSLSGEGPPTRPRVVGVLEEKQAETLALVLEAGETDAPSLAANDRESGASPNKWNNRLAALAAKGILKERREGRLKRYKPILEGLTYGS